MPAHLLPISRRGFLAGAASTVAALGLPSEAAERTDADTWVVFSDTHLLSARSVKQHYVNNRAAMEARIPVVAANFDRAAAQVRSLPQKPAGVILNGDCVHVGGNEEYDLLARKFAQLSEIPIHVTMGNHDHRSNFTAAFQRPGGDRVLLRDRHVSVLQSRHANIVLLDSLTMDNPDKPVKGPGVLGRDQLAWFESVLDRNPAKPTIVSLHHNVDPSETYLSRLGKEQVLVESADPFTSLDGGLEDTDQFLKLIESKPHVKAVLFGHKHQFRIFQWRKLHLISLPPVGYTFGPKEAVGWLRFQLQDGGAAIHVHTLDPKHERSGKRIDVRWS